MAAQTPRDRFGPGTDQPCLAVSLPGANGAHGSWLRDLPCPVIGVGTGDLSTACDVVLENEEPLERLANNILNAPIAAMVLVQHLRATENLNLQDTLMAESFAYATVQQGPEFSHWLSSQASEELASISCGSPLKLDVDGEHMNIILNDPENLNAVGISLRDALCEALDLCLSDNSLSQISLTGTGRVFSTGGQVAEFGEISDPATAHWVRSLRLPAWRLARLQDRLSIHVNGAAIGAGAEIAAFGRHVTASPEAWFQLPELKYGLIPGAGGTASLPCRIGRQRTAFLALSMKRINAQTALEWGLVDELVS